MNQTQIKCLAVFSVFAIIGFGPVSPGCLIGMYVVVMRPMWFWELIVNLYANQQFDFAVDPGTTSEETRKKVFIFLLCLFIVDIAPIPVTPVIAFGIILSRPLWFYQVVINVYDKKSIN